MKRITDKDFSYVNSASTDIRKTFERVRLELKQRAERESRDAKEREQKLVTMRKR